MRVLTPTLSPTLATESATVRLFFLSALLCSVNKAVCDFAHARPIMHCIHLVLYVANASRASTHVQQLSDNQQRRLEAETTHEREERLQQLSAAQVRS